MMTKCDVVRTAAASRVLTIIACNQTHQLHPHHYTHSHPGVSSSGSPRSGVFVSLSAASPLSGKSGNRAWRWAPNRPLFSRQGTKRFRPCASSHAVVLRELLASEGGVARLLGGLGEARVTVQSGAGECRVRDKVTARDLVVELHDVARSGGVAVSEVRRSVTIADFAASGSSVKVNRRPRSWLAWRARQAVVIKTALA